MSGGTVRLTVAQALVRFLAQQYSERDGAEQRLIPGCFGIFGHGNVAGVGQALLESQLTRPAELPYYLARNEQAMVHAAVGFARMRNRGQALACTASIGPGVDQHGDRRGPGHDQPHPRAAAAERRVRHPGGVPGAAGTGAPRRGRRLGERRFPPGVEVLRPDLAARAAAVRAAGGDARTDRSGRDRGGHDRAAAGRPGASPLAGRGTYSKNGYGTSPGRYPNRRRSPGPSRSSGTPGGR